ncbi:MAG TPA: DPP IV N-terminal domain-containing protein [Gemmatimonadaceae bacterium]|nr:DPP IV N-terminal domain-containing protein [Gemmatimonadaceae bacterium]
MQHRAVLFASLIVAAPLAAQRPRAMTAADYARAEKFMSYYANPLVTGASVRPEWSSGDRFWYRNTTANGWEFIAVDAARKSRGPAFDHARMASAISQAAGGNYDAAHLPFAQLDFSPDGNAVGVDVRGQHYACDLRAYTCAAAPRGVAVPPNASVSPDGSRAVFIRNWNLWMRDLKTGKDEQLTFDGVKDFGYATDNAGWTHSDRPIVLWSPDSKKIATYQQDQRQTGEMYVVETKVGHPVLQQWKYPLPGDSIITTIQRVVIDLDGRRVIRFQMPPDQHRSSVCDDVACGGTWGDVQWSPDGSKIMFLSTSRDHRQENLRIADAATGVVHDVMQETMPDFFESGYNKVNWQYLPSSNEFIWYSERTDWGHLYLYDAASGQLKNPITRGDWKVLQVLRVDQQARTIFFTAAGREKGNPYFQYLYRVNFDGSGFKLLTPDSADHSVSLSPDGRYFVDTYSTPQVPPVTVLRDADGALLLTVEKADASKLMASGWKPPTTIVVKARDGKTDLYGLMYTPTHLEPGRKYPIVNHIYPGPQSGSVGGWGFSAARGDAQSLAELGFVVVEINAMGSPMRSHSFQAAYYGHMGTDNGLPDQVSGMKQLAERYKYIDLDRAGIYGHSGGGFATADAMFRYPDFFKVGISESGNHDQTEYEDDWGEKWQGLNVRLPDGTWSYDQESNESVARNLKGHLLLAHGTIDDNVPPYNTLLVVDSLIKYNKDFDLLLIPNVHHGYAGASNYMTRRRWDYFVRYLLGVEPPKEYELKPPATPGMGGRRGR